MEQKKYLIDSAGNYDDQHIRIRFNLDDILPLKKIKK